jgi:hypothetical protein
MEDLDIMNIIETTQILEKLQDDKQLTTFFKMMIRITNSRLNDKDLDTPINWMPLELNIEPELTDETDDE